jgi:rubrerythrin
MNALEEILNFAIEEEKAAAEFYLSLAAQTQSAEMRLALQAFAREEQGHEARLRHMQSQGVRPAGGPQVPDLKIADYQVKMEPGPDMTYRDLVMLAMQKELAANRLYTALADTTPDAELSEMFRQLAQEEAKHKLRFETEYDNLMVEG